MNGRILFVECDEHQHEHYGALCEVARMFRILEALRFEGCTMPVHFIRFNPDAFRVDGVLQRFPLRDRYVYLQQYIETLDSSQDFAIHYLFYDHQDGELSLFQDPDFPDHVRDYVMK